MARIDKADHARILQLIDTEGRKVADVAAEYGCTPANIYALCRKLRAAPMNHPEPKPAATAVPAKPPTDLFAAAASPPPAVATVTQLPPAKAPSSPAASKPVGARLAKPGFGLIMRTDDGETTAPFASLEDLLTAIKPILRSAARSPDPVWFSIGPIDLAAIDIDAA